MSFEYIIVNIIEGSARWQHETWLLVAKSSELSEELKEQLLSTEQDLNKYEPAHRNNEPIGDDILNLRAKLIDEEEWELEDPWNEIEWDELRDFTAKHHCMIMTL